MRLIIAGSRDINISVDEMTRIVDAFEITGVTELVCGLASGIDDCGYLWARSKGIPIVGLPADGKKFGKSAGPRRNKKMALYADKALIIMKPGGSPGSKNMESEMLSLGKPVWVKILGA